MKLNNKTTLLYVNRARIAIALLAIVVIWYLSLSYLWVIFPKKIQYDVSVRSITYLMGGVAIGAAALGVLYFTARSSWLVKWSGFVLFAVSVTFNSTFLQVYGHPMRYTDWVQLWIARNNINDAVLMFHGAVIHGVLGVIPLFCAFLLMPRSPRRLWPVAIGFFVTSVSIFVIFAIMKAGGLGTQRFPPQTNVYSMLVASVFDRYNVDYVYKTNMMPQRDITAQNIVLVVDESVRYDFFNHVVLPEIQHTNTAWHIYNFGLATSMANSSAPSNVLLRKTARPAEVDKDLRYHALIWSLANNAGLTTWLLDGQNYKPSDDFFDEKELSMIDHIPYIATPDSGLVTKLEEIWEHGKTFSLVIKKGAHFPYYNHYPDQYKSYSKALQSSYVKNNRVRQQYVTALDYQTGGFFAALLKRAPDAPTIVIYTSDHGENVDDVPGPPHGGSVYDTPPTETDVVPLIVLSNFTIPHMRAAAQRNKNKLSHFDLVKTLRGFFGYGKLYNRDLGLFRKNSKPVSGTLYGGNPFGHFGVSLPLHHVDRRSYLSRSSARWGD